MIPSIIFKDKFCLLAEGSVIKRHEIKEATTHNNVMAKDGFGFPMGENSR